MAIEITDATFNEVVLQSDKPVMVDFWAAWCGPCRMVAPIMDQLTSEFEGKATIAKLDVDANGTTAQTYRVMSIPTLLIFKNGEVVEKQVGVAPKATYAQKINAHL